MLTQEQMLAVLEQRKLQFEAEKYGQEIEIKVATDLNQPEVAEAATERRDYFQMAIESVQKMIEDLEARHPIYEAPHS